MEGHSSRGTTGKGWRIERGERERERERETEEGGVKCGKRRRTNIRGAIASNEKKKKLGGI